MPGLPSTPPSRGVQPRINSSWVMLLKFTTAEGGRWCPFTVGLSNPQAFNREGGKAVLAGARIQLNTWLAVQGMTLGTMFQSCFSCFHLFHISLPSITACLVPPSTFLKLFGSINNHLSTRECCIRDSQRTKPCNC